VLALYRDLDLSSPLAESGVGALAGALLLSLIGMVYLIVRALAPTSVEFSSTGIAMLMLLIAILFFAGLVAVVGDATGLFVI
jgi:nitrate reductase gamma subunit